MHLCRNSEKEGCHPHIIDYKRILNFTKKKEQDKTKLSWPTEEELEKLDEICKKCVARFFGIQEKKCPVCEGKDFREIKGFEFYNGDAKIREDSFLICKQCLTFSRFINIL